MLYFDLTSIDSWQHIIITRKVKTCGDISVAFLKKKNTNTKDCYSDFSRCRTIVLLMLIMTSESLSLNKKKKIVKILTQRFIFIKRFFGQVKSAFLELKKKKKKELASRKENLLNFLDEFLIL